MINISKKLILIPLFLLIVTGCTGTQVKIDPKEDLFKSNYLPSESYPTLGLRDITSTKKYPLAGNMTNGFALEIKKTGFAKEIVHPIRPKDNIEFILDSKFNVLMNPNTGSSLAKSFITGLTFFLLEPVFWYHFEYTLDGNVTLLKNGKPIKTVHAKTDAIMSMKWLSLGEASTLEPKTLKKAKISLYRQLMEKIKK